MATPVDDSKIIRPFMPSLFHIASVRLVVSLYKDFSYITLKEAFEEVVSHVSTSTLCTENSEENQRDHIRAKKYWLFIPAHLRRELLDVCTGMQMSRSLWMSDHGHIDVNEYGLCLRYDGTIDIVKTAQYLVLNKNINVITRFEIASNYCLEKSIQVLWSEIEESGEMEHFQPAEFSMALFWSNRMFYGSEVSWTQAFLNYIEYLESPPKTVRFSSFFPFLEPEDRQNCLTYLAYMKVDDFRFSLYTLTRAEEEKIMKTEPCRVLFVHLCWPLRELFLDVAERMFKYIDDQTFCKFVDAFISYAENKEYFNSFKLFEGFWKMSPNHLKKIVDPVLKRKVDTFLNERQTNIKVNRNFDSDKEII